jgi:hypothetical protein
MMKNKSEIKAEGRSKWTALKYHSEEIEGRAILALPLI